MCVAWRELTNYESGSTVHAKCQLSGSTMSAWDAAFPQCALEEPIFCFLMWLVHTEVGTVSVDIPSILLLSVNTAGDVPIVESGWAKS